MAASIASTNALVVTARPAAVTRARRPASAVRCDASKDAARSRLATRRDATFGLGAALVAALAAPAALVAALAAPAAANAVECTWAIGCMPGTEPGAPPRYNLPGAAYSPAEAAEERFRAKIRAEKEAEETAFAQRMAAQKAAEEEAAAKAAAEAAAKAAAEAAVEAQ